MAMFNFGGIILNYLLIIDDPSRVVRVKEKTIFLFNFSFGCWFQIFFIHTPNWGNDPI